MKIYRFAAFTTQPLLKALGVVILLLIILTENSHGNEVDNIDTILNISINDDNQPFSYTQNGKPTGIIVDILTRLVTQLGYTPRFHVLPSGRSYAQLINGEMHISIARQRPIGNYSSKIIMGKAVLFSCNFISMTTDGLKLEDHHLPLDSYHIGTLRTIPGQTSHFPQYTKRSSYNSPTQLVKALLSQRVDFIVSSEPGLQYVTEELAANNIIYRQNLWIQKIVLVWSKKFLQQAPAGMTETADRLIVKMKREEVIKESIEKHSSLSVFDNYQGKD
jgi:ABC-type amino acid transport substrate-binding protein